LIIKPFDNQTVADNQAFHGLIIKPFDNQTVADSLFTNFLAVKSEGGGKIGIKNH
jgi:hypothetical protein